MLRPEMSSDSRTEARVVRSFDASAERVYDAWVDPALAGRWLFATPSGEMVRVEIDARVGGAFCFTDRRDGVEIAHVGEYLALDRPRRLEFAFAVPKFSAERTRVTVGIEAKGAGCILVLTHHGVQPEFVERTEAGWTKVLAGLDATLRTA
jgi:uncharacterized protein YndB with AHSA1/START domain